MINTLNNNKITALGIQNYKTDYLFFISDDKQDFIKNINFKQVLQIDNLIKDYYKTAQFGLKLPKTIINKISFILNND